MKVTQGQTLSGIYDIGTASLEFSGTVESIHWDTSGGNFGTATIRLDAPVRFHWETSDRQALLMTIDHKGYLADSRYCFD